MPDATPNRSARTRECASAHSTSSSISTSSALRALDQDDARTHAEMAVQALRERLVDQPETLLKFAPPEAILGACRWYDDQHGRVGKGVLVQEIRGGGKPGWRPRGSFLDEQREYGERICGWLNRYFPQLQQPSGRPHPAAISAVIRLHAGHGKGSLRQQEHGAPIRAAVKAWEERWA